MRVRRRERVDPEHVANDGRAQGDRRRVESRQVALIDHGDPVGEAPDQCQVVQHRHHRDTQAAHQIEQVEAGSQVEVVGRLVEQQHARRLRQRTRQGGPLAFAAGQRVQGAVTHLRQLAQSERPCDRIVVRGRRRSLAPRDAAKRHVLAHAQRDAGGLALGEHRDALRTRVGGEPGEWVAVDHDAALRGRQPPGQQPQQRRLAGTVRADDRQPFARWHLERQRVQQRLATRRGEAQRVDAQTATGHRRPRVQNVMLSATSTLRGAPIRIWSG